MEFGSIIISETAVNSENPQDVINSNISVINLMREEKIDDDLIHEDALMSYYLDYYTLNIPKVLLNLFIIPLERGK
jgi:hypothetical protein